MQVFEKDAIPYRAITLDLFPDGTEQRIVPFLGAGVPLSDRPPPAGGGTTLSDEQVARKRAALDALGLADPALGRFAEKALDLALLLEQPGDEETNAPPSLPSSTELAARLERLAQIDSYRPLAERFWGETDQIDAMSGALRALAGHAGLGGLDLSATSSHCEAKVSRRQIVDELRRALVIDVPPTKTHEVVAAAASHQLRKDAAQDYLILTTNYDGLMEAALADVPHAVIVVDKEADPAEVYVRFSEHVKEPERVFPRPVTPSLFQLPSRGRPPLALLYKIHGTVSPADSAPEPPDRNTVVLSDEDYVEFITLMARNDGGVPAHVGDLLHGRTMLFLGYSLRDWNIRSIFYEILERRGSEKKELFDYAVMRDLSMNDSSFFSKQNINVCKTDLREFSEKVLEERGA